jgi:N-acetylglucosamine kinase-like BadF-type ATPase
MGPPTALTQRALALWGASDAIALLYAFTRRGGLPAGEEDRLAPLVLDAAEEGDPVAGAIVDGTGRVLGLQARASAERLGLPLAGTRVVLTGGVFRHPSERLAAAAMAELPGAVAVRHGPPPVTGALLLALDRLSEDTKEGSARWAASASSA